MFNRKTVIVIISIISFILLSGGIILTLNRKELLLIQAPVLFHEAAYISYISGESYIRLPGTDKWNEPELGQKLSPETGLKTMADGEMDIRITSETLLRIDNNSLLVLSESTLKNLSITLKEGRLFGRFHRMFSNQKLQVSTDEIIAGIRGTDLVFEARKGETTVYALSGITEVYNPDFPESRLLLSFQKKTRIKKEATPSQPEAMSSREIQEFQEVLNAIHNKKVLLVTRAIQFKADTDIILESSLPILENLYKQIARTKYSLEITGHTADIGSANAQYELSLKRSRAVKDYFVEKGISHKRFRVSGYGGSRPVSDNLTEEGRARNRRVEFLIIE
ncbi:MAG: hypothetical protein B6241_09590 [Spirochaetaceae bacterium 4572_59]|nr:MAG: hypothetical protein B6241_09590 [Spirochaetaceae bacterium 4572_59]